MVSSGARTDNSGIDAAADRPSISQLLTVLENGRIPKDLSLLAAKPDVALTRQTLLALAKGGVVENRHCMSLITALAENAQHFSPSLLADVWRDARATGVAHREIAPVFRAFCGAMVDANVRSRWDAAWLAIRSVGSQGNLRDVGEVLAADVASSRSTNRGVPKVEVALERVAREVANATQQPYISPTLERRILSLYVTSRSRNVSFIGACTVVVAHHNLALDTRREALAFGVGVARSDPSGAVITALNALVVAAGQLASGDGDDRIIAADAVAICAVDDSVINPRLARRVLGFAKAAARLSSTPLEIQTFGEAERVLRQPRRRSLQ